MRIFSFLRKKTVSEPKISNNTNQPEIEQSQIIIRQQAILKDETRSLDERNAAYLAIRNEEVRRLNEAYDFNTIEGVNSIPVPCREVNGDSPTGKVDYYLNGKCFAEHWDAGRTELALACLRKAQDLRFYYGGVRRKDFIRLVAYLYEAGKDEEAEEQLKQIDDYFENKDIWKESVLEKFASAKFWGTDLMELYSYSPYCADCAKFVNRVYSISGRDRRFPSLRKAGNECEHGLTCLSFSPYIFDVSEPTFECSNVIKYSNRPFIDERTPEEIRRYDDFSAMRRQNEEEEAKQEKRMIENAKTKRRDMQTLQWLQKQFPSIAPKSLSGFRRMRTTNSKNYQAIVAKAKEHGYVIE